MKLVITKKDIAMFDELVQARDITYYYCHCKEVFPLWVQLMTEKNSRQVIEQALIKGKENQFKLVDTIRLYLDTMIMLGEHFQTDIQYTLFRNILSQIDGNEMSRASQLYEHLNDYTQKVIGDDATHFKEMIFLISISQLPVGEEGDFTIDMLQFFKFIYPQKVTFVGEAIYQELIEWGRKQALVKYDFQDLTQQAIYLLFLFVLGQHFDTDLTCYWLNWSDIAMQIKANTYTLKDLAKTLAKIVIEGVE
ncbi:hypothetical protein A9G41_02005 [Gilliamella sp. Nev5-1]|jgi:hypothetical protein|uniref:hypothetical protein n=1 Tax=Gilliamella sp. Nev5-1 TaxID=3120251 RepID=UPI000828A2EC|nr:hypothetical protein [Gilliamella apicola]OCG71843.1 hypothetical protein A9G41_02005 [Gilliamella apicola]